MGISIPVSLNDAAFKDAMDDLRSSVEKSSAAIVKAIEGSMKKATKATDEAAEAEKKAAAQAQEAARGFEDLGDAAGLPVDKVKKLGEGMKAAVSAMSSAQLGMVAFGGAALAAAAAAAVAVGATGAMVQGVIELTQASADALPDIEKLGDAMGKKLISDEDANRIETANAAIDAVGSSASITGAALASKLAPSVQNVSVYLIALNLALTDMINASDQLIDVLIQVGVSIVDGLLAPIRGVGFALGVLLYNIADTADMLGIDLADSLHEAAIQLVQFSTSSIGDDLDTMTAALGEYIPQAESMVTAQKKVNTSQDKGKDSTDKLRDALYELQMLVAEGQIAPGLKDIRTSSAAMEGLSAKLKAVLSAYGITETKSTNLETALEDLKLQAIDLDIAFSQGAITQEEYARGQAENKAAVDATTAAIQKQKDAIKEQEEAAKKAEKAAAEQAQINTINQLQGGLEGIATLIGGPVAGAITGLILNLKDTISGLTEQLLSLPQILKDAPGLITDFVVTLVEAVIPALMNAVPDIAMALAMAVTDPAFLKAIVKLNLMIFNPVTGLKIGVEIARGLWDAFLKGWSRFASGEMIDDFRESFRLGIVDAIAEIRAFFEKLIEQLKDLFSFGGEGSGKAADAIREIFTLGTAKTSYGDTPGTVKVGPQGMTARFAPNDYVSAGRKPPAPTVAATSVSIDLSDGGRIIDGILARQQQLNTGKLAYAWATNKSGQRGRK